MGLDDLEIQALNIQKSIDDAKANIEQNTKKGVELSRQISREVEEDKYIKMQRYQIFISKMEQLQRSETRIARKEKHAVFKMQSAYMNSQKPLKDLLFYYNKTAVKGFDSSLVSKTLEQIKLTLRARGNKPRVFDDYTTREFDISWRMQMLASHIKEALSDEQYFNHYFMGNASRQLGAIAYKDTEIIQKYFDKLNSMLNERENGGIKPKEPLDFEKAVYGNFLNFIPRHYVFDGFENSDEFQSHITTLMEWQRENDGLKALGVDQSKKIEDLEQSMAQLIQSCNLVKDMQVNMEASIDSLRQQYFKLQEANDKHQFMEENKFIYYDLLELQDLMVKAGYINPEEAEKFSAAQPYEVRMERASRIFYEYVQNYAPELISPQYEDFFQSAQASVSARTQTRKPLQLDEMHDKISLGSLSQSLIGLSQQALSYRKEANGHDYLHDYYEKHASHGEITDPKHPMFNISHLLESNNVRMQRDYLKAWDIFDREAEKMWPRLESLISQSKNDVEGQLHALQAMSSIKVEDPKIRKQIYKNVNKKLNNKNLRTQAVLDGFTGIANQYEQTAESKQVAEKLLTKLSNTSIHDLSFDQKLDILWGGCALELESHAFIKKLYDHLMLMNFQRTDNDLTYDQFQKIREFQSYLQQAGWNCTNEALSLLIKHPVLSEMRYDESTGNYDPFKKRVVLGVARGLTMASIDHQTTLEDNLVHQNDQEIHFNDDKFPFKPDMIIGHNGQKVLLNVITSSQTMRDIKKPDGKMRFRQRILEKLNSGIQTAAIPITSIVDYDISNLKIQMKDDYNFMDDLLAQIEGSGHVIDFDQLSNFGASFTKELSLYMSSLKSSADKNRADQFFMQLYKVFQIKQQTEKQYEKVIYQQGLDALKLELMRIQILFDSMPLHQQEFLNQFVQGGDFSEMIDAQRENIKMRIVGDSEMADEQDLDLNWMGTRQEVELPQTEGVALKKNIVPELINQKFMWNDDYFNYKDWEVSMKEVFDSFNLLIVPRKENETKFYYDRANNQRIVPQGIFPNPNEKRSILEPRLSEFTKSVDDHAQAGYDALTQFEKDPLKMMVHKEQQRSLLLDDIDPPEPEYQYTQKDLDNWDEEEDGPKPELKVEEVPKNGDQEPELDMRFDVSFITNLTNIKQGLKQDYSDKEILDLILVNSNFTETLIEEHLRKTERPEEEEVDFIFRDPQAYRQFVMNTYASKTQEDPFSHFFIKESGKVERVHKIFKDGQDKFARVLETTDDIDTHEQVSEKVLKTFQNKIEDMLIENYRENEDFISLSHQLKSEIKIEYDLKSLMKSEKISDVDPELVNEEVSDQMFLMNQRRRAETKLIKNKIIYKQDQGLKLTNNEKKYIEAWMVEVKDSNIMNVRDSMMPSNASQSTLESLSAEDLFSLNQIPNVELELERHGKYALNDLVLELSHFLDDEVINRVEMEVLSSKLSQDWGLPKDFKIIETRNKEIGMVLNELEEVAWRMSGMFDQKDMDTFESMFSINRNKDSFDKQYFKQDMQSMKEFLHETNSCDNRAKLLEDWVSRKELEIKARMVTPPNAFKKSDSVMFAKVDKKLKAAREMIVAKMLETDEFGNDINPKAYKDLTTTELERISESVCVRLNLFQGDYPAFMPQAVKAVMEHPNLSKSDYSKVDTFAKMFELDWRGDRALANKKEFLSMNPVYHKSESNIQGYGQIGNKEASAMLRVACQPFVEKLAAEIQEQAHK